MLQLHSDTTDLQPPPPPPDTGFVVRACLPACAQIEARTRQDIDEKNVQLRQLVGDSYRCVWCENGGCASKSPSALHPPTNRRPLMLARSAAVAATTTGT